MLQKLCKIKSRQNCSRSYCPNIQVANFFFQLKLNQQAFAMLKQRLLLTKLAFKDGVEKKSRVVIVAAGVSIDKKETNVLMQALEAIMAGYSM